MLCSGNSELGEVGIKWGIFQGDSLSPLVFVLALIPLSVILRKARAAYEFSESKEKINHLLFMDDLKLYSWSEKELDSLVHTVRVFSEDIGMEFGIVITEKMINISTVYFWLFEIKHCSEGTICTYPSQ